MDLTDNIVKKYPKSVHGNQCIGPCYEGKTLITHPVSLNTVTNKDNFCPINISASGNRKEETDICLQPTQNININNKELEINMLNPYIDFNARQFISIYYDIHNFEDSMNWLEENKYLPLETKIRVVKNALFIFSSTIEMVDHRFIDFFITLIKKKYINHIYNNIYKYIGKNGDSIVLIKPENNKLSKKDLLLERINFIIKFFINNDESQKFLIRYFKSKKDAIIINYITDIIDEFTEYILVKIKKTI